MISATDIESIERATIAAVSPTAVEQLGDWLLPFDAGTIGRAKSAAPLAHDRCEAATLGEIEARYRARGLEAAFRMPHDARLEPVCMELRRRGYHTQQPTLVQIGNCAAMRKVSSAAPADAATVPDAAWAAVFLGEGFDPADGAQRVLCLLAQGLMRAGRQLQSECGSRFSSCLPRSRAAFEPDGAALNCRHFFLEAESGSRSSRELPPLSATTPLPRAAFPSPPSERPVS